MKRATLYLARDAIESVGLSMARTIELVEQAFIEKAHLRAQMPPKTWIQAGPDRWFGSMSGLLPRVGYATAKWQSGSTGNSARGLPYLTGMLFLTRIDDGQIVAVMDSTWITQQRTAAASAVAVKHLAAPDATRYAMLGCGVQARSHFEALRLVLPRLSEVVLYDPNGDAATAFAAEVEAVGMRAHTVPSARAAIDASEIIITGGPIVPDAERPIDADWLHRGLTLVTLDYDCYLKPAALYAAGRLFSDDVAQVRHIRDDGYFVDCPDSVLELAPVVARLAPGRTSADETILCMNMGIALEDVVTAAAIYELAQSRSIGLELPL